MNRGQFGFSKKQVLLISVLLVLVAFGVTSSFSSAQEVKGKKILRPIEPKPPVLTTAGDLLIRIVQCPKRIVKAGEALGAGFQVVGTSTFANPINNVVVDMVLSNANTYPMPAPIAVYSANYANNVLLLGGREHISFPGPGNVNVKLNGNNTIPVDTPSGKYYLGAIIDAGNAVAEINERNNFFFCPIEVVGTGGGTQLPDLTVPSLEFKKVVEKKDATGKPYWIFNVIITVKNQGSAAAGPFKVLLERNVGAGGAYTNACLTCLIDVPGLAPGQTMVLPPRQFNNANSMNSLFRAFADNGNTVAEANEANNMNAENFTN